MAQKARVHRDGPHREFQSLSGQFGFLIRGSPAIAENKAVRIGNLAPRSGIAATPGENGIGTTQSAIERFNPSASASPIRKRHH